MIFSKVTSLLLLTLFLVSLCGDPVHGKFEPQERILEDGVVPPAIKLTLLDVSAGNATLQSLLHYTNVERRNYQLKDLRHNDRLAQAAQGHAEDMAENLSFSHTGSDGSRLGTRVYRAGYSYLRVGENIYYRYPDNSPTRAVNRWMNSAGHRANLLNAASTEVGFGYAVSGTYHYYVQVLAAGRSKPSDFMLPDVLEFSDDAGTVVNLDVMPVGLTIEATVSGSNYEYTLPIESTTFELNGAYTFLDTVSPYMLAGETSSGQTEPFDFAVGMHSLIVTVRFWNGDTIRRTVDFEVVDGGAASPSATPLSKPFETYYFVDCGGPDEDTSLFTNNDKACSNNDAVILNAAPYNPAIFQTHRWANRRINYVLINLEPGSWNNVTLGFAEIYEPHCDIGAGARGMDVAVNRASFLSNFDVLAQTSGTCQKAHVEHSVFRAKADGTIVIKFTATVNRPFVLSIEVQTLNAFP